MEKILGRALGDAEIVHHIDNDPQNNSSENLELTNHNEHKRFHNIQRAQGLSGGRIHP